MNKSENKTFHFFFSIDKTLRSEVSARDPRALILNYYNYYNTEFECG